VLLEGLEEQLDLPALLVDRRHGGGGEGEVIGQQRKQLAALGHATDLVKLGLAGNLRTFSFLTSDGTEKTGAEVDYNGQHAGYADQPDENVNYVDAHDNETLYDLSVFKLPVGTSMADRVRMNTLELATATLSQSPSFWHAGTELLRSKSLDRNSYDSGDWFNRIDWTGQESTFGSGLPMAADNEGKWAIMTPLLSDPALKPQASDITAAEGSALDLLRVRSEVGLLRLGSAGAIEKKVTFPNGGTDAAAGVIVMQIDDTVGADIDPELDGALVVFNASPEAVTQTVVDLAGREFALTPAQANGSDAVVKTTTWNAESGTVSVPARTVAVLVDAQDEQGEPGGPGESGGDQAKLSLSDLKVEQGGTVTVTVSGLDAGEQLAATLHSDPLVIAGIPAADAQGMVRFAVHVPADFGIGLHTLVVTTDTRAPLRATLTVVAAGDLATTGGSFPWGFWVTIALLLLVGGAISVRRRRQVVTTA